MTYRELARFIKSMPAKQKDSEVMVLLADDNRFLPIAFSGVNPPSTDQDHFVQIEVGQAYVGVYA